MPSSLDGRGQLYNGFAPSEIDEATPSAITNFLRPPLPLLSQEVASRLCSYLCIPINNIADNGERGIWNTRWTLKRSWHISVTTYGWQVATYKRSWNMTSRDTSLITALRLPIRVCIQKPSPLILICDLFLRNVCMYHTDIIAVFQTKLSKGRHCSYHSLRTFINLIWR